MDVRNPDTYKNFEPCMVSLPLCTAPLLRQQTVQLQTKTLTGCKPVSVIRTVMLNSEHITQWLEKSRARTARASE
jgi:hypothetical protein